MSATFFVFSPLHPKEMIALSDSVVTAVEDYLEEHPDCEDDWGEMSAGGRIPTADEVRDAYARFRIALEGSVLDRLERCRSAFTIDHPGDIDAVGGLQVSLLRFVLERAGDALVLLNDYPLETSEELLAKLKKRPHAKGFAASAAPAKTPRRRAAAPRDAMAGELRAVRVLRTLEAALNDVRVAIDVKEALRRVSEAARTYGALLLEEGAMSDGKAAEALRIPEAEVTRAAEELEAALKRR